MPNISLRTPHRVKKATSVSSDRAAHPLPHRELRHTPPGGKNAPLPRVKKTRNNRPQPPSFLPIPSSFFRLSSRPNTRAHVTRASVGFRFSPSPSPHNQLSLCRLSVKALLRRASPLLHPDFCTKSPYPNDLHRTFSRGELCMNVNASPFCRRSTLRFNGLSRVGEG